MELREAIPPHKTETIDAAWDGPQMKANLRNNGNAAYYRQAFAWQDPDKDPNTKAAYRFIHHMVDTDGNIGAANIKACVVGIGVLNGGMGGTTIPDADRQGVWDHLARHLRDADLTPPELKSAVPAGAEKRTVQLQNIEVRATDEPQITGYAAVFDRPSVDMGFVEVIKPGAFANVLNDDVRALYNHDVNYVLGRTTAGTLQLREDAHGLAVTITPPPTQWARDLLVSLQRGDINQMSFGFIVDRDAWESTDTGTVRTIISIARLFDVSLVTFPAYPDTSAALRDAFGAVRTRSQIYIPSIDMLKRKLKIREVM